MPGRSITLYLILSFGNLRNDEVRSTPILFNTRNVSLILLHKHPIYKYPIHSRCSLVNVEVSDRTSAPPQQLLQWTSDNHP